MKKVYLLLLLGILPLLGFSQIASLDYGFGDYDPQFGRTGIKVLNPDPSGSSYGRLIANYGLNKVVTVGYNFGDVIVHRAFVDLGTLDSSFGTYGEARYTIDGTDVTVTSMDVALNGLIYIAGYSAGPDDPSGNAPYHSFILCLNPDGSKHLAFNGTGITFVELGNSTYESVYAIGLQSTGKLVVAGQIKNITSGATKNLIARFNPDGTSDMSATGFHGGNPVLTTPINTGAVYQLDIHRTSDDIVLMSSDYASASQTYVVRLNKDGNPVTTFNSTGTIPGIKDLTGGENSCDVKFKPDGSYDVYAFTCYGGTRGKVTSLFSDGNLDTLFNQGLGYNEYDFPSSISNSTTEAVMVFDRYKNIILVTYGDAPYSQVCRFYYDGTLDYDFTYNGYVYGLYGANTKAAVVTADDRLMLIGTSYVGSANYSSLSKAYLKSFRNSYFLNYFPTTKYLDSEPFPLPDYTSSIPSIAPPSAPVVKYISHDPSRLRINYNRIATMRDTGLVAVTAHIAEDTFYYAFDSIRYLNIIPNVPAIIIGPRTVTEGEETVVTYQIYPDTLNGSWQFNDFGSYRDFLSYQALSPSGSSSNQKYFLDENFIGGSVSYGFWNQNDEYVTIDVIIRPVNRVEGLSDLQTNVVCDPQIASCAGNYIDAFRLNTLQNDTTGCSYGGYSDFTGSGQTTHLFLGETYTAKIKTNIAPNSAAPYVGMWIDYNNNGSFADPEDFVASTYATDDNYNTFKISLRNDKDFAGSRRLRIKYKPTQLYAVDACPDEGESGETEDYLVILKVQENPQAGNLVTPNNDGKNDFFTIRGINPKFDNRLVVFDKMGDVKLERNNYLNDWDGKDKSGDLLPKGTYFFVFTNGENTVKGFFELMY